MCDAGSGEVCWHGVGFQAVMMGDEVKLFGRWRVTENMTTGTQWQPVE